MICKSGGGGNSLHRLLPSQPKQTVHSSSDAKYQRRKPEHVHGHCCVRIVVEFVRELKGSSCDCREEGGDGRQVEEVICSVLLREANGGHA